jgi:hypothetical protein
MREQTEKNTPDWIGSERKELAEDDRCEEKIRTNRYSRWHCVLYAVQWEGKTV